MGECGQRALPLTYMYSRASKKKPDAQACIRPEAKPGQVKLGSSESSSLLFLNGADHDAFDEIFLQERVQQQNGNGGDDDGRVLDRLPYRHLVGRPR